jgi:hypothetical protein
LILCLQPIIQPTGSAVLVVVVVANNKIISESKRNYISKEKALDASNA